MILLTTAIHGGMLGALMTVSAAPWYPAYADTTASHGLTPLADQQLAGLIMWVPVGAVYLAAALALAGAMLGGEAAPRRPHGGTIRSE